MTLNPANAVAVNTAKLISLRDLPSFAVEPDEDADEFMQRFERCGYVHGWTAEVKVKHLYLAVRKNAMRWHEANKHLQTWDALKTDFLTTFGKTGVDFDIAGKSSRLLASEDPVAFVIKVLNVVSTISPNATEVEKVNRLFTDTHKAPPPRKRCRLLRRGCAILVMKPRTFEHQRSKPA